MARKSKTGNVTLETITPEVAERWLGLNERNRRVNKRALEYLCGVLRRGEWRVNGETIKFDNQGRLTDGQHRLLAVVETGVTIESYVAHNLEAATQQTIDLGPSRKLSDELYMRKVANATTIASVIRLLYRFEAREPKNKGLSPSIAQGLEIWSRHPEIPASLPYARAVSNRLGGSRATHAFLHYWFASIDSEDADAFFDSLSTGENLAKGNPIYALRSILEKDRMAIRRFNQVYRLAVFIKAWNAFREGREVKSLRWTQGGANPEPFPEAI